MFELSIVIPTYNEKKNIQILVPAIAKALAGIAYEIVVVDDSSPDGTGQAVEHLAATGQPIRLITKKQKEGIGAALRVGYDACQTPLIASTDADLSYDTHDLRRLYETLKSGVDLVTGTRHSQNSFYETPNHAIWVKHTVSTLGNRMLRLVSGIPLDDFTANFRAFRKEMWDAIETTENTNTLLFEMILKAYVKGYIVSQIPISFHDRRYGTSKLRLSLEAPKFLLKFVRYIGRYRQELFRRRQQG